jgi:hypothetical protein
VTEWTADNVTPNFQCSTHGRVVPVAVCPLCWEGKVIRFDFMVECPGCGRLFEVSHLEHEVLFTGTKLGQCPKCKSLIELLLVTHTTDELIQCDA